MWRNNNTKLDVAEKARDAL